MNIYIDHSVKLVDITLKIVKVHFTMVPMAVFLDPEAVPVVVSYWERVVTGMGGRTRS